ncbi:MAG: type I DNA topoisomerase [Alphaproteobacteria bacterium]
MNIVIVESPAKAKTLEKYLGADYTVLASYGHVRDLPSKDGSVRPDEDFAMAWDMDAKSRKRLNEIAGAVKDADRLILATDPDREGEAISWHVLEVLRQKKALSGVEVQRVVFNAITRRAVLDAMSHPRRIDDELVEAYLARRALDYLVGFTLSPVLWRKLPGARSAGRVQSVALRLICDRELEIEKFRPREYWSVEALLSTSGGDEVTARLATLDGKKLDRFDLNNEAAAKRAVAAVERGGFKVASIESKPARRHPQPPFTTSTLQQEAARKLGFNASRTMQVAQRLYEGVDLNGETVGLITYMRTDGVQMAPEAVNQTRQVIEDRFGANYTPEKARIYKTKARNAQEAHEAIRPTDLARLPQKVAGRLDTDQRKLYDLIWTRTVASQMESARLERTTVDFRNADGSAGLRATGQVVLFDGFLKLYQEGRDDAGPEEDANRLPKMDEGEKVDLKSVTPSQHFTEPPPRFTEASLVKRMEELGIGRPSTYASILSVLRDRNYVHMDRNRFVPDDKGRLVTAFLESFFTQYVEYDFTASLEEKLDQVSAGELGWKTLLKDFWREFTAHVEEIQDLRVSEVLEALNQLLGPHIFPDPGDGSDPRKCPACEDGQLSLKVGRYGAFIGCSNYPECNYTRQLSASADETPNDGQPKVLGTDPETGEQVTLRSGRFGPYVQLGESNNGEKPKRSGIPRSMDPEALTLQEALDLLSLPREVGTHPETQKPIMAGLGRYGPYLLHDGAYTKLDSAGELFTVGLNRAVTLIAERKSRGGRAQARVLKELGEHPDDGKPVNVLDGRYGPYVKHGNINATLPRGTEPQSVTLEEALGLIAAKAAKKGAGKKKAATKKAAKKTAKKKAAKKKTAKKKAASGAGEKKDAEGAKTEASPQGRKPAKSTTPAE